MDSRYCQFKNVFRMPPPSCVNLQTGAAACEHILELVAESTGSNFFASARASWRRKDTQPGEPDTRFRAIVLILRNET